MIGFRVGEQMSRDHLLRTLVQGQYVRNDVTSTPRHVPRQGRHHRDLPRLPGDGGAHRVLRRRDRAAHDAAPAHRRGAERGHRALRRRGHPLRRRRRDHGPRHRDDPGGARRAARRAREREQAARGAAAAHAHHVRPRDDAAGRHLRRHRELLAPHGRPRARLGAQLPARLLPRGLRARRSTSRTSPFPQIGAMYEGDMSRKRTLVEHGFRLPSAMDNRPLTWGEFLERIGQTVYLSATPGPVRDGEGRRRRRRADHPADRPDRSRGHRQADQGPDRRPHRPDQGPHRAATSASSSPRSPRRWPRTSPTTSSRPASARATCTARSTPCGASSCCASSAWASTTSSSASTCCARASTSPR